MIPGTADQLRCPSCAGTLGLRAKATAGEDVISGELLCKPCDARYPILAGVAILVEDVGSYLIEHVKGISALVADSEIPRPFQRDFREARAELRAEHIDEDLEGERVVALYFMNHYLRASAGAVKNWWKPETGFAPSPLIDSLVREYWDRGPLAQVESWVKGLAKDAAVVELGCGVGGLSTALDRDYLGIDSSFASVALGRHAALGAPYAREIRLPNDLLQGAVSRKLDLSSGKRKASSKRRIDLIVGDMENPPVSRGVFDVSIALNAIDMMDDPARLPRLQNELLKSGGIAIQSGPYVWHEAVSRRLRSVIPKAIRDSSLAVEWLYGKAGFKIEEKLDHLPWLFFKHVRQLEIYSVHLFRAEKV